MPTVCHRTCRIRVTDIEIGLSTYLMLNSNLGDKAPLDRTQRPHLLTEPKRTTCEPTSELRPIPSLPVSPGASPPAGTPTERKPPEATA